MPQYMLLIYQPVEGPPAEGAATLEEWGAYTQGLADAGVLKAGDALEGVTAATTVRRRNGETQITDGPFAETREVLGGYYLIDVPDLDTALDHAGRIPNVGYGSVEVRPVWDLSETMATSETAKAEA